MPNSPDWMSQENARSEEGLDKDETGNNAAPKLVKVAREPKRTQKAFYIQQGHQDAFEDLAYKLKRSENIKAPALIEQAIELLLAKHGVAFD